jgi:hypothetical protein
LGGTRRQLRERIRAKYPDAFKGLQERPDGADDEDS